MKKKISKNEKNFSRRQDFFKKGFRMKKRSFLF